MMKKCYESIRDLEEFGVLSLTGEACGIGTRILCDLTEEGTLLIQDFFRVTATAEPWNSRGVRSVMLPRSVFQDIWIFAHVRAGTPYVFLGNYVQHDQWTETTFDTIGETLKHPVKGWEPKAWALDKESMKRTISHLGTSFYIQRYYKASSHPGTGIDNEHAMTGRIA